MSKTILKAPFPYFGGKSRVAALVWGRFGDVDNFIEPFCGSAAVLLARPHPPRVEAVNDADIMVANFWRATQHDPEAVATHADWPVNEADLHSRHRWLVLSDEAARFRERMWTDPDYYDPRIAGWWCWGLCCWIGGGWCTHSAGTKNGADVGVHGNPQKRRPAISGDGLGIHSKGVHAKGDGGQAPTESAPGRRGVTASAGLSQKVPGMIGGTDARGINGQARPQLADAYARGRGVHGNDHAGTCAERRVWLLDWFGRLRDRLRAVRVCCGDWLRVCDSESVTTRLGVTGIFFDPPYSDEAGRDMGLYATDCGRVAHDVRRYCLERGGDPKMRLALCGYEGEGHEELERHGWQVVCWKAQGGYGNRSEKGKNNATKERIWFSPGCHSEQTLFGDYGG